MGVDLKNFMKVQKKTKRKKKEKQMTDQMEQTEEDEDDVTENQDMWLEIFDDTLIDVCS